MSTTVFLAGATGAIGRQLVPLLIKAGYRVFGTTRLEERAGHLREVGVEPVVLDVFDSSAVETAFMRIKPEILIHQLTDLPKDLSPEAMVEGKVRNARVWNEGTGNLIRAAKKAGTRRAIAQSLAWLYAPGPVPHREEDLLGVVDPELRIVVEAASSLEHAVLDSPPIQGVVLRYGLLYGPGTSSEEPVGPCVVHVQAAANAAVLAIERGAPGVYNVVDDNTFASNERARRALGWNPAFRRREILSLGQHP
ncbi:NAD(P)-dependent oxidoreductase [Variovorax sp. J2P1-59]|nr:NAD(P)-dependent oxidoreductase [Variovorax sp. J2P1-59]MDM0078126.1 NAD(P)-dependent oxidoreductase [Variovorax sp. J2P1-59]